MKKTLVVCLFGLLLSGCASSPPQPSAAFYSPIRGSDFSRLRAQAGSVNAMAAALPPNSPHAAGAAADARASAARLTAAENEDLNEKFTYVLGECNKILTALDAKAQKQEQQAFWLTMSGLITGSIIGPAAAAANAAAHRALISAASGWAGATNFASQALRTAGLGGDAKATERNTIVTNFNVAVAEALNPASDYDARLSSIRKAQAACIAYSAYVPGIQPTITPPAQPASASTP